MTRVLVRDTVWRIQNTTDAGDGRKLLSLLNPDGGETLDILSPPEIVEYLPDEKPVFSRESLSPWAPWFHAHQAIRFGASREDGPFAALTSGRISPEPYQFVPVGLLLALPRPCLLIADDVGLGKTVEAGICLLELIARGRGKRILLIVPPGLISQWQEEMWEKFGLRFHALENAASLERVQTVLSEGIKPWLFLDRVITSVEYLKKREVISHALAEPWDIIVVDEAHYLAESGTPRNPYTTARARLGRRLRDAGKALILLTATPHNGYSHSFRSLLEIVEPTDAVFVGDREILERRVSRSMVRRLKPQIYKTAADGSKVPAFQPREPVGRLSIEDLTEDEKAVFIKVSSYCARTAKAAAGTDDRDLVSFAMQIIKKRMLSSRLALARTVGNRLEALSGRKEGEEPPPRNEIRELQSDLPLSESAQERIAGRVVRSSVPKDAKHKASEKKQLTDIQKSLKKIEALPDPKVMTLLGDLKRDVLSIDGEKAIIFTEYRDTLATIREAFQAVPFFKDSFVELTGGLSARQRRQRMAAFEQPGIRFMLATDAASEGLNLQFRCRRLYHFELPWNPNRMEQRNGRIDRHGQTRPPIIRYLYYPDSPEDSVLSRLVKRILEMQQDRVSTPDILGIISAANIEEALTGMEPDESAEAAATSLFRVIEEKRQQFESEVAPILAAGSAAGLDPTSLSADPMMDDDLDFERFILDGLGSAARQGTIPGTYAVTVPYDFRGPGVEDRYEAFTMRRSVAVAYPAIDVEFITRLHPLYLAMKDRAWRKLTAVHAPSAPGRRMAVRRYPSAGVDPYALFTFISAGGDSPGELISIACDADGKILADERATAPLDSSQPPGEVTWDEVDKTFAKAFPSLQEQAQEAAVETRKQQAARQAALRRESAAILLQDAERYRVDRLSEIDREEAEAKAAFEEGKQAALFDTRDVTGFKARRAAVETFHRKRFLEIEEYRKVAEPAPLQPLGVLFVFPEE